MQVDDSVGGGRQIGKQGEEERNVAKQQHTAKVAAFLLLILIDPATTRLLGFNAVLMSVLSLCLCANAHF
jgi:hypothetical protein